MEEKLIGLSNKKTIQTLQQAIDKKIQLTFKDFIDSGMFLREDALLNLKSSDVVRYVGGFYIMYDKKYYFKYADSYFESAILHDVEKYVWDNFADKKFHE